MNAFILFVGVSVFGCTAVFGFVFAAAEYVVYGVYYLGEGVYLVGDGEMKPVLDLLFELFHFVFVGLRRLTGFL
jgi:hypothetical protein